MSTFEKSTSLQREFDGASDRAAAIVAGAFLDEVLQELLQEFFVESSSSDKKVFQGTGPLATFSAKIELAFRIGLVSQREFRMLHVIRDIRNAFAHQLDDLSFATQSVAARCRNIEVPVELVPPRFIPFSESGEMRSYHPSQRQTMKSRAPFSRRLSLRSCTCFPQGLRQLEPKDEGHRRSSLPHRSQRRRYWQE